MKESIYTIPISEVFEPKCGCPVCALYDTLESRWVEYITGAAMMEPDVRVETNRQGFCMRHFNMMLEQQNRLSVALILQTHLDHIDGHLMPPPEKKGLFLKSKNETSGEDGCFVCSQINREFKRIGGNIAALWARDAEFRELYSAQEFLCLPHYRLLLKAGKSTLRPADAQAFILESALLTREKLKEVKESIDAFCNLFDYRNAGGGKPPEKVSAAIENAIEYLTGERPVNS